MTIDRETLMAYADGELPLIEAKRVERAIAADPALAEQLAQHHALNAQLRGAFAPIEAQPVPPAIAAMLRGSATIVPFAAPAPEPAAKPGKNRTSLRWLGALAASLVIGVVMGQMLPRSGGDGAAEPGFMVQDGQMIAAGPLADALGTQLASAQSADAAVRIGVTFHDGDGALCRTFEQRAVAGIACSSGPDWQIARLYGGTRQQSNDYRQAHSGSSAMMGDAQAMMAGEPLDAAAEAQVLRHRQQTATTQRSEAE